MKKNTVAFIIIFAWAFIFFNANASVRLPAIIGSHMVLQQNTEVMIWGWCDPAETIKISAGWDTATYTAKGSSNAKWSVKIKTPIAGGPFKIIIASKDTIVLDDVLIGEVWACSGQSNMEMSYSWGIKQYTNDVSDATNKSIRFFHIPKLTSSFPQDDTRGSWVVCNPDEMKNFSLAGYFFGQKLQQVLAVPVGLIEASWGGTPAEVWTPADSVKNNVVLQQAADSLKPSDYWPVKTAQTYNAMIYPITNFTIAGAIWYQGESNTGTASTYQQIFTAMIRSWRTAWHRDFPFYFVQIAPFAGYGGISGALLKEAQTKTLSLENTGMVIIDDFVTDLNDIHPKDKKDVGYRLAYLALSATYNKKNLVYRYPVYKNMVIKNNKVIINFSNAEAGLINKGDTIKGFYIAGADKVFMPAQAKISGSSITIFNSAIKVPVAVRFDFTNAFIPTLFNKEGMPVNLFRTDNWNDVNTVAEK